MSGTPNPRVLDLLDAIPAPTLPTVTPWAATNQRTGTALSFDAVPVIPNSNSLSASHESFSTRASIHSDKDRVRQNGTIELDHLRACVKEREHAVHELEAAVREQSERQQSERTEAFAEVDALRQEVSQISMILTARQKRLQEIQRKHSIELETMMKKEENLNEESLKAENELSELHEALARAETDVAKRDVALRSIRQSQSVAVTVREEIEEVEMVLSALQRELQAAQKPSETLQTNSNSVLELERLQHEKVTGELQTELQLGQKDLSELQYKHQSEREKAERLKNELCELQARKSMELRQTDRQGLPASNRIEALEAALVDARDKIAVASVRNRRTETKERHLRAKFELSEQDLENQREASRAVSLRSAAVDVTTSFSSDSSLERLVMASDPFCVRKPPTISSAG